MSIRLLWIQMLFPWFDCSISVWSIGVSGSKNVGTVSYKAIFSGEIPWKIGLIYGRYLQFRILKWPLIWNGTCMHIYIYIHSHMYFYIHTFLSLYIYTIPMVSPTFTVQRHLSGPGIARCSGGAARELRRRDGGGSPLNTFPGWPSGESPRPQRYNEEIPSGKP